MEKTSSPFEVSLEYGEHMLQSAAKLCKSAAKIEAITLPGYHPGAFL